MIDGERLKRGIVQADKIMIAERDNEKTQAIGLLTTEDKEYPIDADSFEFRYNGYNSDYNERYQ